MGLRGGPSRWLMKPAIENGGADLQHAVRAER